MVSYETSRSHTHILTRGLQLIFSILALAFAASSARRFINARNGQSAYLGSSELIFTLIVTYSSMLHALWFLIFVELHPIVTRPRVSFVRGMDLLLLLLLLTAGIVLASSDYKRHCDSYAGLLHCGNISTAIIFTFLSMLPLLITLITSCMQHDKTLPPHDSYRSAQSPHVRSNANIPLSPSSHAVQHTPAANV